VDSGKTRAVAPVASGAIISFDRDTKEGVELMRRRLVLFWGVIEAVCLIAFVPTQIVSGGSGEACRGRSYRHPLIRDNMHPRAAGLNLDQARRCVAPARGSHMLSS
jgi:hypothetical protein